jgi:protein SCO1/2
MLPMFLAVLALTLSVGSARAEAQPPSGGDIGIEERLGTTLGLDETVIDEHGKPIALRELVDLPTLLVFVYYRCPAICDPLLRELAHNLDQLELRPGVDYRVLTISFDPTETPETARTKKAEIFGTMQHPPPDGGWRYLTAKQPVIDRLTEAAGFKYQYDASTQSYVHASSLIFLTKQGKIVRYIGGLEFLPAQLKLAFYDAAQGHQRSVMRTLQRLCYAYDPAGRTYVLQINRLILGLTGVFVLVFVAFLVVRKRAPRKEAKAHG